MTRLGWTKADKKSQREDQRIIFEKYLRVATYI
jgi:hypothetical protein